MNGWLSGGVARWIGRGGVVLALTIPALPALAHTVSTVQQVVLGQIFTIGGSVTLSSAVDTLGGGGLLGSNNAAHRGVVQVVRASVVTAHASVPMGTQTVICNGTSVVMGLTIDDSACSTPAATPCLIYMGASLTLPAGANSGNCTSPAFTIQIDFL